MKIVKLDKIFNGLLKDEKTETELNFKIEQAQTKHFGFLPDSTIDFNDDKGGWSDKAGWNKNETIRIETWEKFIVDETKAKAKQLFCNNEVPQQVFMNSKDSRKVIQSGSTIYNFLSHELKEKGVFCFLIDEKDNKIPVIADFKIEEGFVVFVYKDKEFVELKYKKEIEFN